MPTRDNHSDQTALIAFRQQQINTNGVFKGFILDTADFDKGVKFLSHLSAVHVDGDFVFSYEESDDPLMLDATTVPDDRVIGDTVSFHGNEPPDTPLSSNGVFSTKRFLRCVLTATGVFTGSFFYSVALLRGEYNPQ